MAEQKSGPVKPPILDLEAKKAAGGSKGTQSSTSAKPGTTSKNNNFRFQDILTTPSLIPIAIGTGGGALLGLALAFSLAAMGFWPGQAPAIPDNTSLDLATLERRMDAIEITERAGAEGLAAFETRIDLLEKTNGPNPALDVLRHDLTALREEMQNQAVPDLSAFEDQLTTQIATLSTRIDAVAAGASPDEATALNQEVDQIHSDLATLTARLGALDASVLETTAANTTIRREIDTLTTLVAKTTTQSSPEPTTVLQVPLALSGFETALANGRAFDIELSVLTAKLPGLSPSQKLLDLAETGLPIPEQVANDLADIVPAMLAAKPADPNASWQDKLFDRAKSFVALRPSGAVTGDSPEANISRLESAVTNRDFTAAEDQLNALPAPMRAAAGAWSQTISDLAMAERFMAEIRTIALNPPVEAEATQ